MAITEATGELTLADQLRQRAQTCRSLLGDLERAAELFDAAADRADADDLLPALRALAEANRDAPDGGVAKKARYVCVGDDLWHKGEWWRVGSTGDRARQEARTLDCERFPVAVSHFATYDSAVLWFDPEGYVYVRAAATPDEGPSDDHWPPSR